MKTEARKRVVYRCARCNRLLKRWVFSRYTTARYCYPGEGCAK